MTGNEATYPNHSVLNAIGKCANVNHVSHVNNNNSGANTSVNTLTNDVKSIDVYEYEAIT